MLDLSTVEARDDFIMNDLVYPALGAWAYASFLYDQRGAIILDFRKDAPRISYATQDTVNAGNADTLKQYVKEYDPKQTIPCLFYLPTGQSVIVDFTVDNMPPEKMYREQGAPTLEKAYDAAITAIATMIVNLE